MFSAKIFLSIKVHLFYGSCNLCAIPINKEENSNYVLELTKAIGEVLASQDSYSFSSTYTSSASNEFRETIQVNR